MITAFVYLINSLVLIYFSYKTARSLLKKYNPYLMYFFGTAVFYSLGLLIYFILITLTVITNQDYLAVSDLIGRASLYIGSMFAIQIPFYKFFPKTKIRFLASFIIGAIGVFYFTYNLYFPNNPSIDANQIVHWNASLFLASGLGIILLGVWIPTSLVFITEFIKSKYRSKKAFYLGTGFLLGSIAGILQDFGSSTAQYIFINLLLGYGFVLIFIGLFHEQK